MLTIEHRDDGVEVFSHGRQILGYRTGQPAGRPHAHRLLLPPTSPARPGENITLCAPHEAPWLLGLFFSPGRIDGLDFRASGRGDGDDRTHGHTRSAGGVTTRARDDGAVALAHELTWQSDRGEAWVREARSIIVHPPDAGSYRLDWETALTAVGKERIWQERPEGGDAGGLYWSAPRSMQSATVRLLNSEGRTAVAEVHGQSARWLDLTGPLDGRTAPGAPDLAGVCLMDHPSNPGHPNRWGVAVVPCLTVAATPVVERPLVLPVDRAVRLRYGLIVHDGATDRDTIETAWRAFADAAEMPR